MFQEVPIANLRSVILMRASAARPVISCDVVLIDPRGCTARVGPIVAASLETRHFGLCSLLTCVGRIGKSPSTAVHLHRRNSHRSA